MHSANFDYHIFSDFFDFFLMAQSFPKVFYFHYRCITFVFKLLKIQKIPYWKIFFDKMVTHRNICQFSFWAQPSQILLYKKAMRYFNSVKTVSNVTLKIYRNRLNHLQKYGKPCLAFLYLRCADVIEGRAVAKRCRCVTRHSGRST